MFKSGSIFSFGIQSPDHDYEFDTTIDGSMSSPFFSMPSSSPDSNFYDDSNSSTSSMTWDLLKSEVLYSPTEKISSNYDREQEVADSSNEQKKNGVKRNLFGMTIDEAVPKRGRKVIKTSNAEKKMKKMKTWHAPVTKHASLDHPGSSYHPSICESSIKFALDCDEDTPDLIGDFSAPYALPLVKNGKHEDLKAISHETMRDLISGRYSDSIDEFMIIDCRFPYEFEGGHIKGARNIYTSEGAAKEILPPSGTFHGCTNGKRKVLIFHCEFSIERGPKMLRLLRKLDRQMNENSYPRLFHPEIYLLENGYREFYEKQPQLCHPMSYKPMVLADHASDLTKYRTKSKSFTCRKTSSVAVRRTLTFLEEE